jgi:hypothetical protein
VLSWMIPYLLMDVIRDSVGPPTVCPPSICVKDDTRVR